MVQGNDLVSVIVPAYNAAATIGQTLKSCLAQTHRALEVIVVDDGSVDATAERVRYFVKRDTRVRFFQQRNAGVASARNLAIAHAEGDYVAPLDADDLWHPEKISLQVAAMRQGGPRVGVVYCWRQIIDMASCFSPNSWLPYPHEGDVYAALVMGNILGCSSVPLIRRACLSEVGGYDSSLRAQAAQGCEDLKLYLQLAERYQFALVPRFLVGYRAGLSNMSSDARQMLRSHKIVLAEARRRHPELPGWLFRLGEARYEYYQAKACLRNGLPYLGLVLLLNAFKRDPAAVAYRSAEKPYRLASRWLRKQHAARPSAQSIGGVARPDLGFAIRGVRDPVRTLPQAAGAALHRSVDGGARPFLESIPEPLPGARICSTLYNWRCETAAAGLAGWHRASVSSAVMKGEPIRERGASDL